jgi:hypothetical protein
MLFSGCYDPPGFITRWTVAGDATARTITLPLVNTRTEGALAYNCTVDWGDGSALSTVMGYNSANRVHTYASNGTYNVEIKGTCEGWSFNNGGDKLKIVAVVNWGSAGVFNGFKYLALAFYGCANLTSLGTGPILPSGTGVLSQGFSAFCSNCSALTSIPVDLFRQHTALTTNAFSYSFQFCTAITTVPTDLFRYNVNASSAAFTSTFNGCTSLATLPSGLFYYNTAVTTGGFNGIFYGCAKLTLPADLFFNSGDEATRFLNLQPDFTNCFSRATFAGTQGTAPDFWLCDYGETITLDVAPATDWAGGDTITGQTSAATAVVVAKVSALVYHIKKHFGTFTLGEVIGVTGVSAKLADQGAASPTFVGKPTSAGCFGGAGNSIASLSNYASIPASWK